MMGRTDFGHDRDIAVLERMIAAWRPEYERLLATAQEAVQQERHGRRHLRALERRLQRAHEIHARYTP